MKKKSIISASKIMNKTRKDSLSMPNKNYVNLEIIVESVAKKMRSRKFQGSDLIELYYFKISFQR